jgi:PAS domain S-box-containing protein
VPAGEDGKFLASLSQSSSVSAEMPAVAATMKTPLRVLIVEDSEFDAQVIVSLLRKGGYDVAFQRVEDAESMRRALEADSWQLILADYNLPTFNAPAALDVLKSTGLDLPFLIVSGGIGEDIAVACMKAGAHDYLMKGNLHRLAPAVERELREAANRANQREARRAFIESELRYRLLWETCPDAVLLMDPRGTIEFANPAVRELFGFSPEELIGRPLSVLQPEKLAPAHRLEIQRYLESGLKAVLWRGTETAGLRRDGVEVPIEVSLSDMLLNGQRRIVGFIRDVTERKRAERELRENQEQFRVAREIQQRLFPKAAPACAGFDIAGASYPAEATGGDYYDYLPMLNDRLGIVVGDVTGHGVGPALLMAETRAYLRVLAGRREDVGEILARANGILAEDMGSERYITLFFGRLDPRQRTLAYASAGHSAGYVLDHSGVTKATLRRTGVPLGIQPDTQYASQPELPLATGDIVLLLTDGIEESAGPDDELFGIERTLDVVRRHRGDPASQIVQHLYESVRSFGCHVPQADDITAIVVKVL